MLKRWIQRLGEFSLPWIAMVLLLPNGVMLAGESPAANVLANPARSVTVTADTQGIAAVSRVRLVWCTGRTLDPHSADSHTCPFKVAQGFALMVQSPLALLTASLAALIASPAIKPVHYLTPSAYWSQGPPKAS